jgi:hypothetical protein
MRKVLIWLAVLAVGVSAFFYGGTMDIRSPAALPLVYAGLFIALVALVMMIVTWRASRRRAHASALQSKDAIARWQVYPSDMEAFRLVDKARAGRLWSLKNFLTFPDPVPPEGFPIVIGETSLLFGDKLYEIGLKSFGDAGEVLLQEGQTAFLEISCYLTTTVKAAPQIIVLRIPVPAAAREEAVRAYAHLVRQVKPYFRAQLRSRFAAHFEAVGQQTDAPHRLQRRRKTLIPILAAFILGLMAIIFFFSR